MMNKSRITRDSLLDQGFKIYANKVEGSKLGKPLFQNPGWLGDLLELAFIVCV